MMNLFEIMQAAQGGNAINNLSNQFGLSQQQTQSALEALLPAFSMGLKNQTQSPDMFSQLAGMMMNGQASQQAFEDANNDGIPDHLQQEGNQVLGQIFGSKDVSRAVAQQASLMSGVSSSVLKAMLPVVASMIMGGLFKGASNQGLGGLLGQLAQGMMPGAGGGMVAQQGNNPLGGLLGGLLGRGQQGAQQGGMGGLLGGLLGSMMGGAQQQPRQADPMQAGLEALTNMFGTGRQMQDQHQANLQTIFDAFLKK
ncbi:MAG: DUF937 domain-containing protein [Hyphomicrobiales bacterium]|nr:DUF937 domain-containing protein [Hyphomicrobiales bacterium]